MRKRNPADLARTILSSDPAILGIFVANTRGEILASAMKEGMQGQGKVTPEVLTNRAQLHAIVRRMASKNEAVFGRFR